MHRPVISGTTNFGDQLQGLGAMEGVAFSISPEANYITARARVRSMGAD